MLMLERDGKKEYLEGTVDRDKLDPSHRRHLMQTADLELVYNTSSTLTYLRGQDHRDGNDTTDV